MRVLAYILTFILGLFTREMKGEVGYPFEDGNHDYCPIPNFTQKDSLHWSIDPGIQEFACGKEYKELHCCATGYDQLLWFKLKGETRIPLNSVHYIRENYNQTVVITGVSYAEDAGNFMCQAIRIGSAGGPNKIIHNELNLYVVEQCSNWHRKPDVFVPLDNKTSVNAVKGSNISIQCQAFFGNCYSEECYITWLRIFSSNCCSLDLNMNAANESFENCGRNYTILGFNDDNRVRTVETKMNKNTSQLVIKSMLYIDGLREDDYGCYECSIVNNYGEIRRYINLGRYIPPSPPSEPSNEKYNVVIGSAVAAFAFIWIAGIVIYTYFGHSLNGRLHWKKLFGGYPKDARHYHVTLIYHTVGGERTQDEIFAKETLSESLEKDYNYKVCNISDIPAGESYHEALENAIDNSHCVLFVISPDFLKNDHCLSVYEGVQHEKCQHIYVQYVPISEEIETQFYARMRDQNPINNPETLFKSIRTGQTLTWPQEEGKATKFWKELQLFLPNVRKTASQDCRGVKETIVEPPVETGSNSSCSHGDIELESNDEVGKTTAKPKVRICSDRSETPLLQRGDSSCSHGDDVI